MKIKITVLVLLLVQVFFINTAIADIVTSMGKVTVIYPQGGNGNIKFKIEGDGCGFVHSNHYYNLLSDHPTFSESYALLLSAAHAEESIFVRHDDAACNSNIGTTNISYVFQRF